MNSIEADELIGKELVDGWTILSLAETYDGATGPLSSDCFIATRDNGHNGLEEAFVKMLEVQMDMSADNPIKALKQRIDTFDYECDIVEKCREYKMNRVVRCIGRGDIKIKGLSNPLLYILFERADSDAFKQVEVDKRQDLAFMFRALHNASVGLKQLHQAHITHLDLTPYNLLVYKDNRAKISDFSRARDHHSPPPDELQEIAGDANYTPPELLYDFHTPNWEQGRYAGDLYLLGALTVYMLSGVGGTASVQGQLRPEHKAANWEGSDYQDVVHFLNAATQAAVEETVEIVPTEYRERLTQLLSILLNPDPVKRCHPRNRAGSGALYGLDRFVSLLDLLAKKAELSKDKVLVT